MIYKVYYIRRYGIIHALMSRSRNKNLVNLKLFTVFRYYFLRKNEDTNGKLEGRHFPLLQ